MLRVMQITRIFLPNDAEHAVVDATSERHGSDTFVVTKKEHGPAFTRLSNYQPYPAKVIVQVVTDNLTYYIAPNPNDLQFFNDQ